MNKISNWKREILPLSLIIIVFAIIISTLPYLPAKIPTHWGINGQPDDFSAKVPGAFVAPGLTLMVYLLFHIVYFIDPLRRNYERFKSQFLILRDILVAFFSFMSLLPVLFTFHWITDTGKAVITGFSILLIFMGNHIGTIKQNWFYGIRTPWTLSDETIWRKTHRLGAKIFVLSGLLGLLCIIIGLKPSYFFIIIILAFLYPCLYSYLLFRQLKKD